MNGPRVKNPLILAMLALLALALAGLSGTMGQEEAREEDAPEVKIKGIQGPRSWEPNPTITDSDTLVFRNEHSAIHEPALGLASGSGILPEGCFTPKDRDTTWIMSGESVAVDLTECPRDTVIEYTCLIHGTMAGGLLVRT